MTASIAPAGSNLKKAALTKLGQADPGAIVKAFAMLQPQFAKDRWISSHNPYRSKVVQQLKQIKTPADLRSQSGMVKYIAASAPLHAADAARYLGRSLFCLGINDIHAARHCAYYSELRAAMALLACAGIGVFNLKHVVASSSSTVEIIDGPGTHKFVWGAFSEWSTTTNAALSLGAMIQANNNSLTDYLSAANSGLSAVTFVPTWLTAWGLDLQQLAEDEWRRNESSYRPTDLIPVSECGIASIRIFFEQLWRVLEPGVGSAFASLDEQLIRFALEDVLLRKRQGLLLKSISSIYGSLGIRLGSNPRVDAMLRRKGAQTADSALFAYAKRPPRHEDPTLHFSMIARATFLLRFAIGAVSKMMNDSGTAPSSLHWWLEAYSKKSGISPTPPVDYLDLWDDVRASLTAVSGPIPVNVYSWTQSFGNDVIILSELERVLAWGLAS